MGSSSGDFFQLDSTRNRPSSSPKLESGQKNGNIFYSFIHRFLWYMCLCSLFAIFYLSLKLGFKRYIFLSKKLDSKLFSSTWLAVFRCWLGSTRCVLLLARLYSNSKIWLVPITRYKAKH